MEDIGSDLIEASIQSAISQQKAVALLCGSALKNKGVQPLLDAVIKYLPSPLNTVALGTDKITGAQMKRLPSKKEKLCALAFKVVNDKEKGLVTFFRVYSGIMKNKQRIYNSNVGKVERIASLLRVKADET